MDDRTKARAFFDIGLIAAVAIGCMLPALLLGAPTGPGDLYHHLQIAGAYTDSFQAGVFFPSWIDAENNGYGSVTVRFYPPLAHYVMALLRPLVGSWHLASVAAFTFWSFVGSFGTYLWAKDSFLDRNGALAAAFLFAFAPYHLNQYYNSFMWAEFVALSLLPFAFLFTRRLMTGGNASSLFGLAFVYALMVLSNLPQLIIASLALAAYSLVLLRRDGVYGVLKVAAGVSLGLLLSAYYWVRMIVEMDWLVISQPNSDPMYDFRNHFLFSSLTLDDRFVWLASVFLLIAIIAIVVAVLASGNLTRLFGDSDVRAISIVCVLCLLLMTPLSRPIWEICTPLQRIQFPWRMLSLVSIGSAMLVGYAVSAVRFRELSTSRPWLLLLAGVIAITATFSIKQIALGAVYTDPATFEISAEAMKERRSLDHWLPTWAVDETFKSANPVEAGDRSVTVSKWDGTERNFTVDAGEPRDLRLALIYYPHWRATVNGKQADVINSGGLASVDVPSESSTVQLRFVEPGYTTASVYVSIAAWIALVLASLYLISIHRIRNTKIA